MRFGALLGAVVAAILGCAMMISHQTRHIHDRGERVVVTGASSGIGEQIAYVHASKGARLVIAARREADLKRVAKKCIDLGALSARVVVADFADPSASALLVKEAAEEFQGSLDYLYLNHAWLKRDDWVGGEAEELEALQGRMAQVNYFSFTSLAKRAMPLLEAASGGGRIIVSSSGAGRAPVHTQTTYCGLKHALHGFFGSLRQDLMAAHSSVSITIVVIGFIDTEGARESTKGAFSFVKMARADDTANAMVNAAARRSPVTSYPAGQIATQRFFSLVAPYSLYDALIVVNAQSRPCANVPDALKIFSCLGDILRLTGWMS